MTFYFLNICPDQNGTIHMHSSNTHWLLCHSGLSNWRHCCFRHFTMTSRKHTKPCGRRHDFLWNSGYPVTSVAKMASNGYEEEVEKFDQEKTSYGVKPYMFEPTRRSAPRTEVFEGKAVPGVPSSQQTTIPTPSRVGNVDRLVRSIIHCDCLYPCVIYFVYFSLIFFRRWNVMLQ